MKNVKRKNDEWRKLTSSPVNNLIIENKENVNVGLGILMCDEKLEQSVHEISCTYIESYHLKKIPRNFFHRSENKL